jgi:hypothetical protein
LGEGFVDDRVRLKRNLVNNMLPIKDPNDPEDCRDSDI